MIIQKISQKIFSKAAQSEIQPSLYKSNPFAPSSKINILTADIFQHSDSKISGMNEKIAKVVEFATIARNKVSDVWNRAKTITVEDSLVALKNRVSDKFVSLKNGIQDRLAQRNQYKVENLVKRSDSDLKELMQNELKLVA